MRVIGTAGHVDHGKSTLIKALTGTHPDRLKEEKEREMTIDLGFAWWELPNGEEVGVVDVPGHRDFIENMLAGIGGIDAVLFVVAADEGVMPQTREHLAILDLLKINEGVVVLTKTDMVQDESWLSLVEEEVRDVIAGTVLGEAEIVRVSAKKGEGIEKLQEELERILGNTPPRVDVGGARMPIDRVFTMPGFGTVVTGTLLGGTLEIGEEVAIQPGTKKGRIRGLQTHKKKEDRANPGSRVAVNITGLGVEDVNRGQVVSHAGSYKETRRIDVQFEHLSEAKLLLKHDSEMKFFVGAAEVLARVRLLGVEVLKPGERGWLQLEFREPVIVERGDRFILRRPSPGETIGGGAVLDPHPKRRHKRFDKQVIERFEGLAKGNPEEVLWQTILAMQYGEVNELVARSGLEEKAVIDLILEMMNNGRVEIYEDPQSISGKSLFVGMSYKLSIQEKALQILEEFHKVNPLSQGISREEYRTRLKIPPGLFDSVIKEMGEARKLMEKGPLVYKIGFEVSFSPEDDAKIDALLKKFEDNPFSPPTIKTCVEELGEKVYRALVDTKKLLVVSDDVVFRPEDYEKALHDVIRKIEENGSVSLAEMRDVWGTTRRYVQALLEYMDKEGITVRDGDVRKLKN